MLFTVRSFEILLACTVVFPLAGNIAYTLLEYRLGHRSLLSVFIESITWIPFLYVPTDTFTFPDDPRPLPSFFFFGGLSIHLSMAILAHLFSYNITWGATTKEV